MDEILKSFVEKGADLEHDRWSRWQKYMFSKFTPLKINSLNAETGQWENIETGNLVLHREFADRWNRQIDTPYKDLSEKEKESDRKETRNYLPLLEEALAKQKQASKKEFREVLKSHWVEMDDLKHDLNGKCDFAKNELIRDVLNQLDNE